MGVAGAQFNFPPERKIRHLFQRREATGGLWDRGIYSKSCGSLLGVKALGAGMRVWTQQVCQEHEPHGMDAPTDGIECAIGIDLARPAFQLHAVMRDERAVS
jgi:hypothetical protein